MKDTNILFMVLGALVIGAVGFFAGRHVAFGFGNWWGMGYGYRPAYTERRFGMMGWPMMREDGYAGKGRRFGHGMMGGFGEITKIDGNTVTLKIDDETTREVTLSANTVVNIMTKGTTKDLKVGQEVMITGGGFWNDNQTVIVKPQ